MTGGGGSVGGANDVSQVPDDEAFRWLDRGFVNRAAFMDDVKITPAFDVLHADPRWAALLRRMGFANAVTVVTPGV